MTKQMDIVVVRDPDGGTDIHVFIDGEDTDWQTADLIINAVTVDAGAGYDIADWSDSAETAANSVHPGARDAVLKLFNDPPGAEYIEGWADAEGEVPQS